jgi:hypothetical protein
MELKNMSDNFGPPHIEKNEKRKCPFFLSRFKMET